MEKIHFNIELLSVTNTGFTIKYTPLQTTCVRLLRVQFLAVDRTFNYHFNVFNHVEANFTKGPFTNITNFAGGDGTRAYVNQLSLASLATLTSSPFTTFNPTLALNGIAVYLTGVSLV